MRYKPLNCRWIRRACGALRMGLVTRTLAANLKATGVEYDHRERLPAGDAA